MNQHLQAVRKIIDEGIQRGNLTNPGHVSQYTVIDQIKIQVGLIECFNAYIRSQRAKKKKTSTGNGIKNVEGGALAIFYEAVDELQASGEYVMDQVGWISKAPEPTKYEIEYQDEYDNLAKIIASEMGSYDTFEEARDNLVEILEDSACDHEDLAKQNHNEAARVNRCQSWEEYNSAFVGEAK